MKCRTRTNKQINEFHLTECVPFSFQGKVKINRRSLEVNTRRISRFCLVSDLSICQYIFYKFEKACNQSFFCESKTSDRSYPFAKVDGGLEDDA